MTINELRMKVGTEEWKAERQKEYAGYLNIRAGHLLHLTKYRRSTENASDDDEYGFVEKTAAGDVVAVYEAWHRMPLREPLVADHGYRKYSARGDMIEEAVIG